MSDLDQRVHEKWLIKNPASQMSAISASKDGVDSPSMQWQDMEAVRELPRDLMSGSEAMREGNEKYLPRWEGEDKATEYKTRKKAAVLVPFYRDAVRGLVDKVFSRPLRLSEVPPALEEWWENVDHLGTEGSLFLRQQAFASLGLGLAAVLVDHQRREATASSRAEEERQGLRPFCKPIPATALLEAKSVIVNGRQVLERVRYYDPIEVDSGDWISEVQDRIVVLYRGEGNQPARMEVWVHNGDDYVIDPAQGGPFMPPETAPAAVRARFQEIPLVPVYTGAHDFWYGEPPLRPLAEMNLQHYQKKSNFDTAVAISSVPMHAFIGWTEDDLSTAQWGPLRFVATTNDQASVQDISFGMSTADIALKDLEKLERYMALAAMDPQSTKATGEEKSTIRMLDEAKVISRLQAWALSWLAAGQQILDWAGAWVGIEEVGRLEYLEEVFDSLKAQPDWSGLMQLAALVDLPADVMIEEAKRFGVLSDEWDSEEIAGRILTAGPGLAEDSE